jgi:hypothetical protein
MLQGTFKLSLERKNNKKVNSQTIEQCTIRITRKE